MKTAFVLGGGGALGAHEVGMLRALSEASIRPDLIVGTSVGAINGVIVAADPAGAAKRVARMWQGDVLQQAFSQTLWGRAIRLARSGTHLLSIEPLRRMLNDMLPGDDFADLELPFHCVAASIESACARWFSNGPIVPAVLASCAVPGLLPPVEVDGEHYFDGGLVDSIPVGRSVALGARTVYVLHAGRIERPLAVPRRPWEVGLVAFEIARRHRFHEDMSGLPDDVQVHVLPALEYCSLPVSMPGCRCGTCRKPLHTRIREPRCAMTGPGRPWTGTPPTSSPRISLAQRDRPW